MRNSLEIIEQIEEFKKNSKNMDNKEFIKNCADLIYAAEEKPELTDDISKMFTDVIHPDSVGFLELLNRNKDKESTEILFKSYKLALMGDKDFSYAVYGRLCSVAERRPELSSKVLDMVEVAFQSDINDNFYFRKASPILKICLENDPSSAERILNLIDKGFDHADKGKVISPVARELDQVVPIINKCSLSPELVDKCLPLYKKEFQCPNAHPDSLKRALEAFGHKRFKKWTILESHPEKAEELMELCSICINSKQNNMSSFNAANNFLDVLKEARPDLEEKATQMQNSIKIKKELLAARQMTQTSEGTVLQQPTQSQNSSLSSPLFSKGKGIGD